MFKNDTFFHSIMRGSISVCPYNYLLLGMLLAFLLGLSEHEYIRLAGVITGILFILSTAHLLRGGRLLSNDSSCDVFVLTSEKKVMPVAPGQTTLVPVIGLAIRGIPAVFKITNGIYVKVNAQNTVVYSSVAGKVINQFLRKGGLKTKEWVKQQPDLCWVLLQAEIG